MKVEQFSTAAGNSLNRFFILSLSIGALIVFFTGCIHVHKEKVVEQPVAPVTTTP